MECSDFKKDALQSIALDVINLFSLQFNNVNLKEKSTERILSALTFVSEYKYCRTTCDIKLL